MRFPHSDISGSKVAWHLPEAYRRHAASFIAFQNLGIHRTPFKYPLRALASERKGRLRTAIICCCFSNVLLQTLKLLIFVLHLDNAYALSRYDLSLFLDIRNKLPSAFRKILSLRIFQMRSG